jgi:WhiB family redox-sensing transcriptional regulator
MITFIEIPAQLKHIRDNAACAGAHSPDSFFPTGHDLSLFVIRRYCHGCPVRAACLQWAIDKKESGTWGGMTERQRRKLQGKPA